MITIVTSRAYLLCESINCITMQYNPDHHRGNKKVIPFYDIHVDYNKASQNGQISQDNNYILTIRVAGEKVALQVYKEIVKQIREQLPDQVYLDKMLEDILSGGKDIHDEPSEKSVSSPRKKKRRNKKVSRRSSKSSR